MFSKKRSIIYITKSKIKLVNVTMFKKPKVEPVDEALWMSDSLENILLKFKKNVKGMARILLAEDFVYTVTLGLPSSSYLRDDIKRIAQELIPENLDQTLWDFKEIESLKKIQVIAVAKTVFETVVSSITKVGLRIEAIESLSFALARLSGKQDKPLVFVHIDDGEILLTLAKSGIVIATKCLATIDLNAINQFTSFAKDQYGTEVKDIIICGNTSGTPHQGGAGQVDLASFENAGFNARIENISPIVSLANKEDIKGRDEEVLNLISSSFWQATASDAGSRPESPTAIRDAGQARLAQAPAKRARMTNNSRRIGRWTGAVVIIIIIAAVVAGFLFFKAKSRTDQNTPKPTHAQSKPTIITPSATPSAEVDFSSYSITILNGSGREGEAGRLQAILEDNGFTVAEIGNAESSNYQKTEIHHKENVPESVTLTLDKIINTLYDFSISADLEEDSKSDIVIIIGSAIK